METYPRPYQLIAFAGRRCEARPIEKRDLPSAARNQTGTFQLADSISRLLKKSVASAAEA
jgi:hypothetical protein